MFQHWLGRCYNWELELQTFVAAKCTFAGIASSEASDDRNKIRKRKKERERERNRRGVFLYSSRANVDQPGITEHTHTQRARTHAHTHTHTIHCTRCSLSLSHVKFDCFHQKRILSLPRQCLGKLEVEPGLTGRIPSPYFPAYLPHKPIVLELSHWDPNCCFCCTILRITYTQ